MSIQQQFADGINKVLEGLPKEEQEKKLNILGNAFKANGWQECSARALVNKREPQIVCPRCNKCFLVEEIVENNNVCPKCGFKEE